MGVEIQASLPAEIGFGTELRTGGLENFGDAAETEITYS